MNDLEDLVNKCEIKFEEDEIVIDCGDQSSVADMIRGKLKNVKVVDKLN